jgi:hypothetical protein
MNTPWIVEVGFGVLGLCFPLICLLILWAANRPASHASSDIPAISDLDESLEVFGQAIATAEEGIKNPNRA